MKILVIDNLTQTFEGDMVKSGLQKSSLLDARAFSKFYDTTYAYCGIFEFKENFKNLIINEKGAKDVCLDNGESTKISYKYIKSFLKKINYEEYDLIVCHCHSISMLEINYYTKNKNILFVIHDVLDLTYMYGLSNSIKKLRKNLNNNVKIYTNSNYSIQKANSIYDRRKNFDILSGDDIFDGYIKHFIFTEERPEITDSSDFSITIGRYERHKNHHKLYGYKNYNHKIIHCGIKDPIRDKDFKYYNNLIKKANDYREGLNDSEIKEYLMKAKYIVLPCWHEGFGFTAFEAGIYGAKAITLHYDKPSQINIHATDEYLTAASVPHINVPYSNQERLFEELDKEVTLEERKEISRKLIDYFTIDNYVKERISIFGN